MKASYKVYKNYFGTYTCSFMLDGRVDRDHRGTSGTGCKNYEKEESAIRAGKRYVKNWEQK